MNGSLAGPVDVQNGTLGGNGIIADGITLSGGGILAPGESVGKITTNGAVQFGSGSIFGLDIDPANGTADQVSAVGVSIGLGVTPQGNLIGADGGLFSQVYTIIDNRSANAVAGIFSNQPEGSEIDIGGDRFLISYVGGDGNDVTLRMATLAADYNHNGTVDAADYTVWRNTLGSTTNLHADGNGNGIVDSGDYTFWKSNFGAHNGSGSGATAAVPEPSVVLSGLTGMLAMYLIGPRERKRGQNRRTGHST